MCRATVSTVFCLVVPAISATFIYKLVLYQVRALQINWRWGLLSLFYVAWLLFSDAPFAPRELKAVEYNVDYVTLSWTGPEHDGGSPILGYVVEKRDSMMNMWSQAAKVDKDTFTVKVTNLFEGQNYLFRVAAENQCGRGAYVELIKPVVTKLPFGELLRYCFMWFGFLGKIEAFAKYQWRTVISSCNNISVPVNNFIITLFVSFSFMF